MTRVRSVFRRLAPREGRTRHNAMKLSSRLILSALLTMTGLVGCQCGLCKRPTPPPPPPPPGPTYIPAPPPTGAVAAPPAGAMIAPPPSAVIAPPPGAASVPQPRFPPAEVRNYPPGPQSVPGQTAPYDGGARGYLPEADMRQPVRSGVQLQPPQVSESASPPAKEPPLASPPRVSEGSRYGAATPSLPSGIPQYAMAREQVANGLRPLADGFDWLKENGFLRCSARPRSRRRRGRGPRAG